MLTNPLFANTPRFLRAEGNAPPMRRGEGDRDAVRILQNALIGVGVATMRRSIRPDGTLDGDYGTETVQAVRRFQRKVGLVDNTGQGDGVVGRNTLRALDAEAPRQPVPVTVMATLAGTQTQTPTPRAETPQTTVTTAVRLPTPAAMLREYQRFRDVRGLPCGQDIRNQCAIRMSVALMRCDIGFFFDRTQIRFTHSATNRRCGTGVEHNASASRLFGYLRGIWQFRHYDKGGPHGMAAQRIQDAVANRCGIVYFEDCFNGGPGVGGDHIDYWDGAMTMNDRMNYNGPGEREAGDVSTARWFRNSRRNIWFLAL